MMRLQLLSLLILSAILSSVGCRQPLQPPGDVAGRAPASIEVNGTPWGRLQGDFADDPRLHRLFRERKELAESPDLSGTLVAYASPTGDRIRFYWIQASSDSDGWTWIETNDAGKYFASGQGAGERFPSP